MSDLPKDWAIGRVIAICQDLRPLTVEAVTKSPCFYRILLDMARYIEAHEEPPVDRKLLCAREAVARMHEKRGNTISAKSLREGLYDHECEVIIESINLYEEGYGK